MTTPESQQGWKETKREGELNDKGEFVIKNVTMEAVSNTKGLSIEKKDIPDLIVKIAGLVAILIAGLSYASSQKDFQIQVSQDLKKIRMQDSLSRDNFIQQKRFEALSEIKKKFTVISETVESMMPDLGGEKIDTSKIKFLLEDFRGSVRSNKFLFDSTTKNEFNGCVFCYTGICYEDFKTWVDFEEFLNFIDETFSLACSHALGIERDVKEFEFVGMPYGKVRSVLSRQFLEKNLKAFDKM